MTQHIDMVRQSAPSGERCRSARTATVTTFCHSFRGWQTAPDTTSHAAAARLACPPPVTASAVPLTRTSADKPSSR